MATVPATASTLSGMDVTALRRIAWRSKYKQDSVRPSVFTAVKTIFKVVGEEIMILKSGVLLDVSNLGKDKKSGGQSVRCALRTPMREAPREGTGEDMLGYEDETDLLYWTAFYNEIKKSVKFNTWGYDFNDTEYLNYNEGYSEYTGLFWQELHDHRFQTALLLGFSNELTKAPVSQVQTFNPNWAIPNLNPSSYPTWDPDTITTAQGAVDADSWYPNQSYYGSGTFVENIANALVAASGTGATSNCVLNVDNLFEIHRYIEDEHVVEPLTIDGQPTYIFKMASRVYEWLMNPNNTGSVGKYWAGVKDYISAERATIPGEMGRLCGSFLVVKDLRCPTLAMSGNAGSRVLTPGYIRPGNNDDRNKGAWSNSSGDTNYSYDICTIIGAEALGRYTRDDLMTGMEETTEYGKRKGQGSYMGDGIMIPRFDKGTATATSLIYRGSCIVPVGRRNVRSA